jgi:hypothetical protein
MEKHQRRFRYEQHMLKAALRRARDVYIDPETGVKATGRDLQAAINRREEQSRRILQKQETRLHNRGRTPYQRKVLKDTYEARMRGGS